MVVPDRNYNRYGTNDAHEEYPDYGEPETPVIISTIVWDGILDMLFTMQCYMIYTVYAMLAVNRYRRLARCSLKGRRGGRR